MDKSLWVVDGVPRRANAGHLFLAFVWKFGGEWLSECVRKEHAIGSMRTLLGNSYGRGIGVWPLDTPVVSIHEA